MLASLANISEPIPNLLGHPVSRLMLTTIRDVTSRHKSKKLLIFYALESKYSWERKKKTIIRTRGRRKNGIKLLISLLQRNFFLLPVWYIIVLYSSSVEYFCVRNARKKGEKLKLIFLIYALRKKIAFNSIKLNVLQLNWASWVLLD